VDRREACVARGRGVSSLVFEVVEERRDERRIELGDVELARWGVATRRRELE